MALGPGKYDDLCTRAREEAGAESCVLIITNGKKGSGFSMQTANLTHLVTLPQVLRNVANEIEKSFGPG